MRLKYKSAKLTNFGALISSSGVDSQIICTAKRVPYKHEWLLLAYVVIFFYLEISSFFLELIDWKYLQET